MKNKDLLIRAIQNIKRGKLKAILLMASICISTISLFFMYSIGFNIEKGIYTDFVSKANLLKLQVNYNGKDEELANNFNLQIEELRKIEGIKSVDYKGTTIEINVVSTKVLNRVITNLENLNYYQDSDYSESKIILKVLGRVKSFLVLLGSAALMISVINISNTISMSINQRKEEIGIMIALGMSYKDLKKIFLFESLIIISIGSALGCIIKSLLSPFINNIFLSNVPFSFSKIDKLVYLPIEKGFFVLLFIFVIILISTYFSLYLINKLDIANMIKGD